MTNNFYNMNHTDNCIHCSIKNKENLYFDIYSTLSEVIDNDNLLLTRKKKALKNNYSLRRKIFTMNNIVKSDIIQLWKDNDKIIKDYYENKIHSNEFINITDGLQNKYSNNYLNKLNILVPYKQTKDKNYDFISSGVKYGVSFIAMNFQFNDDQLVLYNDKLFKKGNVSNGSFTFKIYNTPKTNNYFSPIIKANEKSQELQEPKIYTTRSDININYPGLTDYL